MVWLIDHTGYPVNHDRYTMRDIVVAYEKSRDAARVQTSVDQQNIRATQQNIQQATNGDEHPYKRGQHHGRG